MSFGQVEVKGASENDSLVRKIYFPNKITLRAYFISTSNTFNFSDKNQGIDFTLIPNKQNQLGFSAAFRSIIISYSFAPKFLTENRDNQNSELQNLNLRTFLGQWMVNFQLYKEKGFFIDVPELDINEYFPNFKTRKTGGTLSYILNKDFSFRAIVSQDEKQLVSAGSFIPNFFFYYTDYELKSEGINEDIYSYDMALAPAYYYNFVPSKNILLSAGGSAGLGLNITKSDDESLSSLLTELNFRASVVYDKNNFYLGAHYSYLILNHNFDRSTYVQDDIPYLQVFIGYRFKAPRFMVKTGDDFNKKLGL
ncbi:DUF4421 family protein [Winogradskyella aurantiaca]|uniref:DUF4421 family protein n=1 Tax=Winogradskyella aurantiaca TaxID=2219558 RepID=UPI0013002709|nr:DUF4421 family protein [Winogradskyella aurantiaca]